MTEMKLVLMISVVMLLITYIHCRPSNNLHNRRLKRGFKDNIAMGHGFGKRADTSSSSLSERHNIDRYITPSRQILSNHKLAQLIRETPGLAHAIVAKFVDTNGDGYVSGNELFPEGVDDA